MAFDVRDLVALRRVSAAVAAPCGTWAVVAAQRLDAKDGAKYISDLWRVALDGDTPPVQLTRGEFGESGPAFGPDGALYFMSNRPTLAADDEGHERRQQVFRLDPRGGDPVCVTREPLGVDSFAIQGSAAAPVLAVLASRIPGVEEGEQRKRAAALAKNGPTGLRYTAMPARYWDHWLSNNVTHALVYRGEQVTDLTPDAERLQYDGVEIALSADGARLVLPRTIYGQAEDRLPHSVLDVFDTVTGARTTHGAGVRAEYSSGVLSPDGALCATVLHVREVGACGKRQLGIVSLDSGTWRALAEDADLWLTPSAFSADGARLIVTGELGGGTPIFGVDLASGALTQISAPGATHSGLSWAGERLIGVRSAILEPPGAFTCALEPGSQPVRHELPGASAPDIAAQVTLESIEVPTTDGRTCQAFLVKPREHEGELATVCWVHGGPIGAWADAWQWRWNPLAAVSQGYAMILPNPRGSTGFGQQWVEGIWGNVWGAQCFEDVMAVVEHVAAMPDVDGERMALMGGSFGGYMTSWVGTQTGDRFRCLINHAGVTSFDTFHATTDLPAYWHHMLGLFPWRDRDALERYSPLRHIEGWRAPTLIIHGGRDYRVDVGEALGLFEALQAHGVPSELLVFPDENHWILRPHNIIAWYEAVFEYLGRYLSGGAHSV
jgi:dipeptidyl aminopeptidase/acylaminoacyl peptidase